jgi:hypothetical protein
MNMIDPTNTLEKQWRLRLPLADFSRVRAEKGAFLRPLKQKELDSQNRAVLAFRVVIGWINPRSCVLGAAASGDRGGWGK